ncbi:MAG: ATP-binding protein, partial [Anaerolineales bacterium]
LMFSVYLTSRRLTKPLSHMATVAESIARGDLAPPVEAQGEDEIGRLAASFERMRQRLKARLDEMDLLLQVRQQLASSFQLRQVMPPILAAVRRLTLADMVRVVLLPVRGSGEEQEDYQAGEDPGNWAVLDEQILDLCRDQGQFVLENPSRARAVLDLASTTVSLESLLGLPIMQEDSFVGSLWLGHRAPHAYSANDIHLLTILAGQLGDSVASARLFQLAEQERSRLAAVLEATPDGVIVIDHNGLISLANPSVEVVLRGTASQAVGKPATDWLASSELEDLLLHGPDDPRAAEIQLEGGRVYFASASNIHTGGTDAKGRVCVLWEITHYKKLDTLKSELVSTVSHDLRAPLTLMRGYATVLPMVGAMNDQQREFVAKILDSIDQMSRLVDNVLDLGRIEAEVGLKLEIVPVQDVIREVIDAFRPQAVNKRINLEAVIEEGNQPIEADATLLRQSIANLVDNAIKYTPQEGRVTVRAFQTEDRQIIRVEDTGIGVAPADQARLFERFYRARRAETLQERGSGLGLAIVKSVVEQHGGKVSVESELGVGSSFILELPMHQPERQVGDST